MRLNRFQILSLFLLLSSNLNAQSPFWFLGQRKKEPYEAIKYVPYATIAFGAGSSNYFGELVPSGIFSSTALKSTRWNVGLTYTKHFHKRWSYKASMSYIRIAGDDNYYDLKVGDEASKYASNFVRNLHFRNDLKEFSFAGIYELKRQTPYRMKRPEVSPYLFVGIAAVMSSPQARGVAKDDQTKSEWIDLRNLKGISVNQKGTEGVSYPSTAYAIPLGFGVRYKLDKYVDLGIETTYRIAFSDYLDDVSDDRSKVEKITDLTFRSTEEFAANTLQKMPFNSSNSALVISKGNDSYFTTQVQLILHFGNAAGKSQAGKW